MPKSYNGWVASANPESIGIKRFRVPIKPDVFLTCREGLAPLFMNLAADFHREVAPLDNYKPTDDWGYNYRQVPGTDVWSCHASGTAIDLNATQFPMGKQNMTDRQVQACHDIAKRYRIVTWGGTWAGTDTAVDQMHWEISRGVTKTEALRVIKELGLTLEGKKDDKPDLRKALEQGDRGELVLYLQKRLNRHGFDCPVDGRYGSLTVKAVRRFEQANGLPIDGICTPRVWMFL